MSKISALERIITGLALDRHTVDTFNKLKHMDELDDEAFTGHVYRGMAGFTAGDLGQVGPFGYKLNRQAREYIRQNEENKKLLDKAMIPEEFYQLEDDVMDWSGEFSRDTIDKAIESTKMKLDKPLYVTRSDNFSHIDDLPAYEDLNVSARVIDPEDIDSWKGRFEDIHYQDTSPLTIEKAKGKYFPAYGEYSKVYRLEPGVEIYHPAGLADGNEVVLKRSNLEKMKSMEESEYIKSILKGAAPFGLGAISITPTDSQALDQLVSQSRDTIEAPKYQTLGQIANILNSVETPIGRPFGGLANWMNKMNYGDNISYWDRLGAMPDLFDFSKIIGE